MRRLILVPDGRAAGMVWRRRENRARGARVIGARDSYTVGMLLPLDDLAAPSRARRAYRAALHADMVRGGWPELVPPAR